MCASKLGSRWKNVFGAAKLHFVFKMCSLRRKVQCNFLMQEIAKVTILCRSEDIYNTETSHQLKDVQLKKCYQGPVIYRLI
ncbi:hypothetical protein GDO86_000864 [Hymenochirus boettgeri]|uniref:Uncharacterized protein n=1 Tax=Hymenochirus boettgeri TaxID=247094 RepID=A0A8T2KFQ3_9PIPI|nr:hypothetical protein GDO86_000864 [Hymenochirus boettgeri]